MKKSLLFIGSIVLSMAGNSQTCIDTLFYEPFNTSLGQMTAQNSSNGSWIFTNNCAYSTSPGHSAPGAALFSGSGCFFDNPGLTVSGDLLSPSIAIPTLANNQKLYLKFNVVIENECGINNLCSWDVLTVLISNNNGMSYTPVASSQVDIFSPIAGWYQHTVDISNYAGSTIQIAFNFDSGDDWDNSYDGIYVDDILITKEIKGFVNKNDTLYCLSGAADTLEYCAPASYYLTGNAVSGNVFNPQSAGIGSHTIYLGYNDTLLSYSIQTGLTVAWDSTPGTSLSLSDDDLSAPIPLGFNFNFKGTTYTDVVISSNGFISFPGQTNDGCCAGQALPDANTPNNLIAFAWNDLNPMNGGSIQYVTTGTPPNQVFILTFDRIRHCCGSNNDSVTVQVKLFEGTNVIEIHSVKNVSDGSPQTMGLEDALGQEADTISGRNGNPAFSVINEMTRFTPNVASIIFIPTDSIELDVLPAPIPSLSSNSPVCIGQSIIINEQNSSSVAWNWTGPNGFTSTQQNIIIPNATTAHAGYYVVEITDTMGCKGKDSTEIVIQNCAGIADVQNMYGYTIRPNPAYDQLNIEVQTSSIRTVRLYSIEGKEIFNRNISSKREVIEVKDLPSGMYLLETTLETGEKIISRVVIKS